MEKILTGKEVLMIKATRVVRDYQSETEGFKGKRYRVFASGTNAFAVHEDEESEFTAGLKAKGDAQIAEVQFALNEDGQYSLVNWLTWGQLNSLKENEVKNESITVENFRPAVAESVGELEGLS